MRSKFLLMTILVLLFVTCIWIVLFWVPAGSGNHLGIGFLFGSLYGHSILSSGWIVFGPGGWSRLPLALLWLLAVPCTFVLNTMFFPNSPDAGFIWVSAGAIMAIVQVLAWPMRYWWRLLICRPIQATEASTGNLLSQQFGIRELMILTTIVAVFIGSGRLMLPFLLKWIGSGEFAIFAFLVVASVVICIPTTFSILAMRNPLVPTVVMVMFVAIATYIELPLLSSLGLPGRGPDRLHLILINTFSLMPIVIVCVTLRLAGYQLSTFSRK